MQNRPTREELIPDSKYYTDSWYKQALIIDKHLPKTIKAGDYLLSANENHHPLDPGYTPEALKELHALVAKPEFIDKFFITANSGIICFTEDIELKEEWFDAE